MKYLMSITFIMLYILSQTQDKKMKGKYKMEYDYGYILNNGIINFDNDIYTRKQVNGKKIKGDVNYKEYFIMLYDKNSTLQVKFPKREMGNDTIFFRTTDLNDKSADNGVLEVYGGKLIRIK